MLYNVIYYNETCFVSFVDQCKTYQEEITSLTEKLKLTEKESEKKVNCINQ